MTERERIRAKVQPEIDAAWAEIEARQAQDAAERAALVDVHRERRRQQEEARERQAEAEAREADTSEEGSAEMSDTPTTSQQQQDVQPFTKAAQLHREKKSKRAEKQERVKTAMRGQAAAKVKLPGKARSRARANAIIPGAGDLIAKAIKQQPGKPNGEHPRTDHYAEGKKEGVKVATASRGGFHVIVMGKLNRVLKGVFETAAQAERAAKAEGLTVKATPAK